VPSLEDRVAALERVLARQIYGGTDEEALAAWQANCHPAISNSPPIPSPEEEPEPEAKPHRATLHAHKKR